MKFEFYDHIPHSMRGMIQLRCTWLLGKHNNHKLMPTESDKKVLICSGDTVSYRIWWIERYCWTSMLAY